MAFPTIAATNTSQTTSASGTFTVDLPASISAGDLLMVYMAFSTDVNTLLNTPAGWTILGNIGAPGGHASSVWFVKSASGSEGATLEVTLSSGTTTCSHWSYRISAATWHGTSLPEVATSSVQTANPDPPNLTPFGLGAAEDILWFASVVADNVAVTVDGYPANYTTGQSSQATGDHVGAIARDEVNATSENPGTFTLSADEQSVATTLAVRPAAAAVGATIRKSPRGYARGTRRGMSMKNGVWRFPTGNSHRLRIGQ